MSKHPEYNDLMVEALYGEIAPEDRRRLEHHLEQCEPCAEEFEGLQATLDVMAQRERAELPESYWASYRRRFEQKRAARSASFLDRLRRWGASLPALLPQTGGQWALQGAVAVVLLAVGLWLGHRTATAPGPTGLADASGPSAVGDLLLARAPVTAEVGRAEPVLGGVGDVSFDADRGTVSIRYRTVNHVTVQGRPGDPTIQRLLRTALLDRTNPAAQLNAMQTLAQASVEPSEALVQPLTYLLRKSDNPDMRLRAMRALRALHRDGSLASPTQDVLVGLLLDTGTPTPLRIEALQTLTAGTSRLDPSVLYPMRNDSNAYLRYQARSTLQAAQAADGGTPLQFQ
jgi:hypothetical protein